MFKKMLTSEGKKHKDSTNEWEVKSQRLEQKNKYFLNFKQLNAFDHPYYIHESLDSETSTFLLVNITLF